MLVAQYKISADIEITLNFSMKQVFRNVEKCCSSFLQLGHQYIFVSLQIEYL